MDTISPFNPGTTITPTAEPVSEPEPVPAEAPPTPPPPVPQPAPQPSPQPATQPPAPQPPSQTPVAANSQQPAPIVIPEKVSKKTVRADRETKEYVIESLSMMISTGVTVGEALESIAAEIPAKPVKKAILGIKSKIDEGLPLSVALAQSGLFNQSVIALIKVGEDSGRLPENLSVIATQMHKSNMMNAKIKSAMLYPAFLLGLLFLVGTGVGVFLLPRLLTVLDSLKVKVGLMTKIIIIAGNFFGHFGLILAAGAVVGGIILAFMIRHNRQVRIAGESVIYHVPGIKKLLFESEVSRFGFILGTLLESGLPVVMALHSLAESMVTYRYQRLAENLRERVEVGDSFAKAFNQPQYKKLLPSTIRQLITSAEKSGNLSPTFLKIGEIYEDKADITARNLETLLEPIILVIIAVCVLFVALAVILPIYSLVGGI